jgi:glycosyltransferase involved in cell wall biosynthesis
VAQAELPALYRVAHVVAVPSKPYALGQEQESRVIKEAMACGTPVLVTACGGNVEVAGDAALVVPPADHPAMTRALRDLLAGSAETHRLGAQARRRALEHVSPPSIAEATRDLYLLCRDSATAATT